MNTETLQFNPTEHSDAVERSDSRASREVKSEAAITEQVGRIVGKLAVRMEKLDPLKPVPRTNGWEHKSSVKTDGESIEYEHRPMGSDKITVEEIDGTKHTATKAYRQADFSTETKRPGDILAPTSYVRRDVEKPQTITSRRTGRTHLGVKGVRLGSSSDYYSEAKPEVRQEAITQSARTLGKIRGAVVRAEQERK